MSISPEAQKAIAEEEAALAGVIDSLYTQLKGSERKLQIESKLARELTSAIVAAQRDEDKAMLASDEAVAHALSHKKVEDIEVLQKLIEKPYFARFAVEEEEERGGGTKQMEYKLGFSANPDCRIVDWRSAPISKLYYEYREGDEYSEVIQGRERNGKIVLRNSVEIEHQQVQRLSCRFGQFVRDQEAWKEVEGRQRSRAAQGASYAELPNILALITAEQFQTITEEATTAILIQGIAGSGKTTVALHRLAWLLHQSNSDLKPAECLVIVLTRALKAYVTQTLPSMNVHGVRVLTFHEWAAETLAHALPQFAKAEGGVARPAGKTPKSVERVLRSLALLKSLEEYEAQRGARLAERLANELPWSELPAGIRKIFDEARSGPHLMTALGAAVQRGLSALQASNPLYAGLAKTRTLLEATKNESYFDALLTLLAYPKRILELDDTRLLDSELINQARAHLLKHAEQRELEPAADGLLLRLAELREGSVMLAGGKRGSYRHIVVDEVQDFSPTELVCIIGAVDKAQNLTLVGDTAQKLDDASSFPGWEKLQEHWRYKDSMSKYISLTVSHRSTLPIMRLADFVQQRETVTDGRQGRVPIWFKCNTESKGIRAVIGWLEKAVERYPSALSAVLCCDPEEARHAYSLLAPTFGNLVRRGDDTDFTLAQGIIVSDVRQVKGLEFLNVLIWNPSARTYPDSAYARNLLYVAITRAEENLSIVTWQRPTPLLPDIYSKLVRGVDMSIEEI